jgi:hypothetical protein
MSRSDGTKIVESSTVDSTLKSQNTNYSIRANNYGVKKQDNSYVPGANVPIKYKLLYGTLAAGDAVIAHGIPEGLKFIITITGGLQSDNNNNFWPSGASAGSYKWGVYWDNTNMTMWGRGTLVDTNTTYRLLITYYEGPVAGEVPVLPSWLTV